MTKTNVITIIVFALVILTVVLDCTKREENGPAIKTEQDTEMIDENQQSMISYETLRQWNIPAGGVGMEILEPPEATKGEVLDLAKYLRSSYLSKGFVIIQIFDSREAYLHRDDPNYPEDKYYKHFLVDVVRNPKTGHDKISWVAEGRQY